MIGRPILKAICGIDLEFVFQISEPESARVEKMRAEILQHACAVVPPSRFTHEASGSIPIKHSARIDATEHTGRHQVAHAHEMRLETVIIGGIADGALATGELLELDDRLNRFGPKWLF